jgi:DNA-binding XRE family transcriptional regulator
VTDQQILRLIGQRIRTARLRANMTQECLAELVGVHWKTISHVERGSYPIALTTFARLSQFLETSPNRELRQSARRKDSTSRSFPTLFLENGFAGFRDHFPNVHLKHLADAKQRVEGRIPRCL